MSLSYESREKREKRAQAHPVWRGIGCLLLIIIPIFSYAVANELLPYLAENVSGFRLPSIFLDTLVLTPAIRLKNFLAVFSLAFVMSLFLFALVAVINAVVYNMAGGYTLKRFEAPPERYKKKRKYKQLK
ncbi:MAG: hypothetical protein N2D54_08455 [Chloroflexota bacterium]